MVYIDQGAFAGMDIPTIISLIEKPFSIRGKTASNGIYGAFSNNTFNNATLYVPVGTIDKYKSTEGWKDFVFFEEGTKLYKLTYIIDGEEFKTIELYNGVIITPEPDPVKEGYTFSGWSEIPETMPDHDVTVTGTFTINKYKITYIIDGEVYLTEEVEYGSKITPPNPDENEGYDFAWDDYPDTMPAEDITINGTYTKIDEGNTINGYEYVDLGLPSGLLWATKNVGATSPAEYGSYFAWGETSPKSQYLWLNYKYADGSNTSLTKYCYSSEYGTVDNKQQLDIEDDAARYNS